MICHMMIYTANTRDNPSLLEVKCCKCGLPMYGELKWKDEENDGTRETD